MAYSIEQMKSVVGAEGGLAKSNLFAIVLPPIPGTLYNGGTFNILAKSVELPGRQAQTLERNIGGYRTKVVNGNITDDIMVTFYCTNSMKIKEYFEAWMKLAWNPKTRRVGYLRDYAKVVEIKAMSKPRFNLSMNLPTGNIPGAGLIPEASFGPLSANLAAGSISLDFGQNTTRSFSLENAYPLTINPIQLSNENDGFIEMSVSFTYSEWTGDAGIGGLLGKVGLSL